MRRNIVLLLPLLLLLAVTWDKGARAPVHFDPRIRVTPLRLPSAKILSSYLGPFQLDAAWRLTSPDSRFSGYSSMLPEPDGRMLAFTDGGKYLRFSLPGATRADPEFGWVKFGRKRRAAFRDVESVAYDPSSDRYWLGVEGANAIIRLNRNLEETGKFKPVQMKHWGANTGPEAMTRLPDGRFVAIREVSRSWRDARLHQAVLFDGDPIKHPAGHRFFFDGPDNFSVVDMALLPDGRALILMRRLLWAFPMRFAGRIVIADPAQIRPGGIWHSVPLASLASVLPVDNFEAIAVVPRTDSKVNVWLMSDDNNMRILQRTLLWKLTVDPRRLPWPRHRHQAR
ncbi:hypothetical protein LK12_21055 [Novosphingobium malaysiense]|uniref:Phytase-like domain-containing protein n=1 Tax=Novosphingobium malaysiense TaxID=1348853 RepID=A0A0B1ZF94_9SPHN|nr:hypothetical protein LK12_21055 [Novosphingobium malaysiense]